MPRRKEQSLEDRLSAKGWRSLPQDVKLRGDTKSTKRRRKLDALKLFAAAVLFGGCAVLFVWVWRDMMREISEPAEAAPVALEFVNNGGVLDEAWCRARTNFDGVSLPNLSEMRRRLLSYPQVVDARVQRLANGKIRVELRERRPIARLVDSDGNARLVAADGVIFPAETFPQTQAMLPLLTDAKIVRAGEGGAEFDSVAGTATLFGFIELARTKYKQLFSEWDSISLKDFPTDARELSLPWAALRVIPRATAHNPAKVQITEIVFSPAYFKEDLQLLAATEKDGRLESLLAESAPAAGTAVGPRAYRILFITNRKTPGKEFREIRIIPVGNAPAAGTL